MDISELREDYRREALNKETLQTDPMEQFKAWFSQARKAGIKEPNSMILATVDPDGQPWTRTVLLKKLDARGLVFFTNFESRKASQIAANPKVSVLFLWLDLERQVSINGTAEKISSAESMAYFVSRPLGSRLGAWSSRQSSVITSRSLLEAKLEEMKRKFSDGKVPLPSFWGGYRVLPHSFEFWQGRRSRLHDRFLYSRSGENLWQLDRLQP
ncbi:MAG: pyridoxamine 5'-phosphate oxidase [Oceanipulchritudo sp.]